MSELVSAAPAAASPAPAPAPAPAASTTKKGKKGGEVKEGMICKRLNRFLNNGFFF